MIWWVNEGSARLDMISARKPFTSQLSPTDPVCLPSLATGTDSEDLLSGLSGIAPVLL